MVKSIKFLTLSCLACWVMVNLLSCQSEGAQATTATADAAAVAVSGQATVRDDVSQKDIVKVAAGSPDHKTLVTAVTAAGLLNVLSNAGPFTVFAPTDAAFAALPPGTVETLLKPEKLEDLKTILQYHVTTSALKTDFFSDGMSLSMVKGGTAKITVKDGKYQINGANIVASVQASNGMVHVIDAVLLPPAK